LYKDHMTVNTALKGVKDIAGHGDLVGGRRDLYDGAKAVFGVGEAITGTSRGKTLKGFVRAISGETGPKGGYFHGKLLSKKQDMSARSVIAANPDFGFNEAGFPADMLWKIYEFHIIRDLVKGGYTYVEAKKAVDSRNLAAVSIFNKIIKLVPALINRAPTLMASNVTAFYPIPVEGKTIQLSPLVLKMFAADYDGDSVSVFAPITPEAISETRNKLLPQHHIYDFRRGQGASLTEVGHEAVLGSVHITEPDMSQKPVVFRNESEALQALKLGKINGTTPISFLT